MLAIGDLIDAGDGELSFFIKKQATQKKYGRWRSI
jgi:hypothetical protein